MLSLITTAIGTVLNQFKTPAVTIEQINNLYNKFETQNSAITNNTVSIAVLYEKMSSVDDKLTDILVEVKK